ncbi:MAG: DUF4422 domain-containing protein [Kiritimatiellae bacterium]|nr:DUF4422 domain-containing protein [Kiritimatiellia bacterium]
MNTKILITYKDNYEKIENEILTPIQTGRAISNEIFDGMIGDDTGDNISSENNKYSELSAQYWAWKNYEELGNPDYIGHMQYRRHFIFNKNASFSMHTPKEQINGFSVKFVENLTDDYIKNIGLDENTITSGIENLDIVVVKKSNMRYIGCKNAKEDFLKHVPGSQETDYNILKNILLKNHPNYINVLDKLENEPYRHFYHMFVMKREIFFEYCSFIFPLLKEIDGLIDYSYRGTRGGRVLGYLGEMLLCLFVFKKHEEGMQIGEYYSTVILKNKKNNTIIKKQCNVCDEKKEDRCVVYNIDNLNFYHALASIFSLNQYLVDNKSYDLVILYSNLNPKQLNYINSMIIDRFNNIIIKNDEEVFHENEILNNHSFLKSLYFLKNYRNIVYINSRLRFNNITNFSQFENDKIRVSKHPQNAKIINIEPNTMKYISNILELDDPYKYFIDDIIFINTCLIDFETINEKVKTDLTFITKQIDILNYIFNKEITYLPENYVMEISLAERKKYFSNDEYDNVFNKCICFYKPIDDHLIGVLKYIKNTPFYEEILFESIINIIGEKEHETKLLFVMNNIVKFKLKKALYRIKKRFYSGRKQEKYQKKYDIVKKLIKEAKHHNKSLFKF